ncbi:protein of unknown function [Candidatus Nitrosotalea okcheonensis]|uniref:Uncharacterized protein n=1 Tax=Candidatus Nitrosotalea okcheonensis TaxID=1903276 RepID=A0A2H1FFX3_9ARCH|nr:protein of unknown function [Candidatus Nitrosotalea okcheonensis]
MYAKRCFTNVSSQRETTDHISNVHRMGTVYCRNYTTIY